MPEWFRRSAVKIKTADKRDTVEGQWIKCPRCAKVIFRRELEKNDHVCPNCTHHFKIPSSDYFRLLLDNEDYTEIGSDIRPVDSIKFNAVRKYTDQLTDARKKSGLTDAIKIVRGEISTSPCILGVMDFDFIGGSMGSVVGERIRLGIDRAREERIPLVLITASGGARMQEGAFSLMQMAKTSAKLAQFNQERGLYISVLTNPTTGGTTASFAMLGDLIFAEPNALIGFAGARVIKQTIGEDLPEGFQRAEFLLEKGFLDDIIQRRELKSTLTRVFRLMCIHDKNPTAPSSGSQVKTDSVLPT